MVVNLRQDEALELWRETLSASVRDDSPDLSARQMAIVLTVYTSPPPHTVAALAQRLDIAKPAVTRALDRLSILGFVRRARDQADRRIVHVQRTVKGAVFLSEFADQIAEAADAIEPGFGVGGPNLQ
jgi:DNA-binding MarR family transcriptional regulator